MPDRPPPRARICHVSPGRVRVRIPERRYDTEYFTAVKELVSAWPGVESVEVNPVTAGMLIRFALDAGDLLPGDIPLSALENDLFTLDFSDLAERAAGASDGQEAVPLHAKVRDGLKHLDARLRALTGGADDLRSLVFLSLLAGGCYQLFRGNVAAPAVTLLWYAADALSLWRDEDVTAAAAAAAAAAGGPIPGLPASSGETGRQTQ
ncbi:MAG TPA: hypothetical protein VGD08_20775 [Stellaceae bacterium]|jgi:hypothetical protein